MSEHKSAGGELVRGAGRAVGHVLALVVGLILMVVGVAMGVTMVLLPVGIPLGLVGLCLLLWGLFGRSREEEPHPQATDPDGARPGKAR